MQPRFIMFETLVQRYVFLTSIIIVCEGGYFGTLQSLKSRQFLRKVDLKV